MWHLISRVVCPRALSSQREWESSFRPSGHSGRSHHSTFSTGRSPCIRFRVMWSTCAWVGGCRSVGLSACPCITIKLQEIANRKIYCSGKCALIINCVEVTAGVMTAVSTHYFFKGPYLHPGSIMSFLGRSLSLQICFGTDELLPNLRLTADWVVLDFISPVWTIFAEWEIMFITFARNLSILLGEALMLKLLTWIINTWIFHGFIEVFEASSVHLPRWNFVPNAEHTEIVKLETGSNTTTLEFL